MSRSPTKVPMKKGSWIVVWALFLLGGALPSLRAEKTASEKIPALSTASLTCDFMEFREEENVVFARGHAVVVSSGTRLEADELTVYLSSRVVVAQGNAVLISSGTRLEADELTLYQSSREAIARGRVYLNDEELSVLGDSVHYNWGNSTGEFQNIYIQQGVWRTWGRSLERLSPTHYRIKRAAFSSCDLNPPHYHFRGGSAEFRVKERMSVTHIRPAAEKTPFLYFPYYTRSLKDNRWTYTVDPGNSARNGLFAKNVFSYPIGENARARVLWDHYTLAGNGFGGEFSYSTHTVRGSVSGYQIHDKIDDRRRWNLRLGHWQQLNPRWQVQSRVAMQSDESVNDVFVGDDYQRSRQLGESDLAFTRTGTWYTARLYVEHDRTLDPVQKRFVTSKTILPQFGFQSSSLRLGQSNAYFNFGGNFRNEYDRPQEESGQFHPILPGKDHFRQYADGTGRFSWRLPVTKKISLEPSLGISEVWQSHQVDGLNLDPTDILQGKGFTGLNMRHRVTRSLDYDLGHTYRVRWRPNTFRRDHSAPDHGVELNGLNFLASYRPSSSIWGRASTFYDLRDTEYQGYHTPRQRFSPPTVDAGFSPNRWFSLTARESVQLYPARKIQSSVLDFRLGPDDKAFFSSGFSYNVSRPGELDLTNGAAFQLTPGWWLSGDVRSTASGSGSLRYNGISFTEKNLVVRRDLHCWVVRVNYRERTGVHEIFFRLDLKTNLDFRKNGAKFDDKQFYPARRPTGE
jgi:lipopolysaccharide export system protein LptA